MFFVLGLIKFFFLSSGLLTVLPELRALVTLTALMSRSQLDMRAVFSANNMEVIQTEVEGKCFKLRETFVEDGLPLELSKMNVLLVWHEVTRGLRIVLKPGRHKCSL